MTNFDPQTERLPSCQNILVLGASGRTGKLVVKEALAQNYRVTALVRLPERLPLSHPNLTIVKGDVMDVEVVEQGIKDCDTVISVLGWTKDSPKNLLAISGKNTIDIMSKLGVTRLITVLGAAIALPDDPPSSISKRLIVSLIRTIEPDLFTDSQNLANIIRNSDLNWTIVRVPRLANGDRTNTYRYGQLDLGFGAKISREDLAHFLVQQLASQEFSQQAPAVAS